MDPAPPSPRDPAAPPPPATSPATPPNPADLPLARDFFPTRPLRCRACGYDVSTLGDNAPRCPECGELLALRTPAPAHKPASLTPLFIAIITASIAWWFGILVLLQSSATPGQLPRVMQTVLIFTLATAAVSTAAVLFRKRLARKGYTTLALWLITALLILTLLVFGLMLL